MPSDKGFVSAEVAWALAECIKVLDGVGRARRLTLRILYATPWMMPGHWWKPWTTKWGDVSKNLETPPLRQALLIR
jgi:hypothetical protein